MFWRRQALDSCRGEKLVPGCPDPVSALLKGLFYDDADPGQDRRSLSNDRYESQKLRRAQENRQ